MPRKIQVDRGNHKGYEAVLYSTSRVRILVYVDSFEIVSHAALVLYMKGFVCFLVCEYFLLESRVEFERKGIAFIPYSRAIHLLATRDKCLLQSVPQTQHLHWYTCSIRSRLEQPHRRDKRRAGETPEQH